MALKEIEQNGFFRFGATPESRAWARAAHRIGIRVASDPAQRAKWLRCGGTWFVGVDVLPTARDGSIADVPLRGPAIEVLSPLPGLHPAQLSVTYPGYPLPSANESAAAFRYRRDRDAAHVDGLLAEGPDKRRFVREQHAFILGLPLNDCDAGASPLVVWRGSHRVMTDALSEALANVPPDRMGEVDVTGIYQAARRKCFSVCERVELPGRAGEAVLLHPVTLHGIAPWGEGANAPSEGRMVAYFRPELKGAATTWPRAGWDRA